MRKIKYTILLISAIIHFGSISSIAQNQELIDSIYVEIDKNPHDSIKARLYFELGTEYYLSDPDTTIQLLLISKKISKQLKLKRLETECYGWLAFLYNDKGEIIKSIELYHKSLDLSTELGLKDNIATILGNLATMYNDLGETETALNYYSRSIEIQKEISDSLGIAYTYNNLAMITSTNGNHEEALMLLKNSLIYFQTINNDLGIGMVYANLGLTYIELGKLDSAKSYLRKAIIKTNENNDVEWIAFSNLYAAELYYELEQYDSSIYYGQQALIASQQLGYLYEIAHASKTLYKSYKANGNTSKAIELLEQYVIMVDSTTNTGIQKESGRMQMNYKFEKEKALQEADQREKDAAAAQEKKQQQMMSYFFAIGFVLIFFIALILLRGIRVKKKANRLIKNQKLEVELQRDLISERNKEITESINYAKTIQSAILPSDNLIKQHLPESFILFKPKDIVSGDFYWVEEQNNTVYFAVADCTGHGVPGAMISVMCSNALTKSLKELQKKKPAEILDACVKIIESRFTNSSRSVNDGMDIALCCFDKKEKKLQFSGANNPLWIIRNGELIETKADKQPIGKYDKRKPYQNQELQLKKDDIVYVFSDGFADQFGGLKGKKYKSKAFKSLLLSIQDEGMNQQKKAINKAFEDWSGQLEQVDDICIMGVKV